MIDQEMREKVIKGLECCTKKLCIYKDTEKECPYSELCGEYEDSFEDCTTALSKDALALLKAQEAVEPSTLYNLFICPVCKNALFRGQKFCHECGKRIEWEGR